MVREITENDFEKIALFLSEFSDQRFSKEKYLKDFNFWWKDNPSFKDDTLGWIIEDDSQDNTIKGFLGNIPVEYELDKSNIMTYNATTWYVHPDYKKEASYLAMAFFTQGKDFLLNSTPSKFTEKIFLKLGCKDYAVNQQSYIKIESVSSIYNFISKKITNKLISSAISFVIFYFIMFTRLLTLRKNDFELKVVDNIDMFKRKENKLYIKNLNWILLDNDKKVFSISNKKEQGYIITQFIYNKVNGMRYIQVLDFDISLKFLDSVTDSIISYYRKDVDFIFISNYNMNKIFSSNFINITSVLRPICLVKSERSINNKIITSIFGEKGFILWK